MFFISISVDDSDLLDEVTTNMAVSNMKKSYGYTGNAAKTSLTDRSKPL